VKTEIRQDTLAEFLRAGQHRRGTGGEPQQRKGLRRGRRRFGGGGGEKKKRKGFDYVSSTSARCLLKPRKAKKDRGGEWRRRAEERGGLEGGGVHCPQELETTPTY